MEMIEAVYDHLQYMDDSSLDVIKVQNNNPIKVSGLWFDYNGERLTPSRVYFGCHFYRSDIDHQNYGGVAWCHYDNALRAVFKADGTRYREPQLRNVCANYDGETLTNFYRE